MTIAVQVMIIILKQQELEVEEVTATIRSYINQFCRSELRFCLPELRRILISLLQKHFKGTKHLEGLLGEDHPVAMIWTQREDQLLEVANKAIHLSNIVLRSYEENYIDGTDEAEAADTASRPQDSPVEGGQHHDEAQPGAGLQAADTIGPAKDQVQVCTAKVNDAAHNLPVGDVASGGITVDADTASRPQNAPAGGGQHHDEAKPGAGLQTADTIEPAKDQVHVCTAKVKDAAHNLPVGDMASGGITVDADTAFRPQDAPAGGGQQREEAQPGAGLLAACTKQPGEQQAAPKLRVAGTTQPAVQVQVSTSKANDAAYNLLPGSMVTGAPPSHAEIATKPSQILDRCLARASAAAKKLDRLSGSQAKDGKPVLARNYHANQALQSPGAQLDRVLARTASLLEKLDKLSSRVSGTKELDQRRGQVTSHLISSLSTPTLGLVTVSERPAEIVGGTDRGLELPAGDDQKRGQDVLRHSPESGQILQFTTEPMAREATCQQEEQLIQFTTKPVAREIPCQQRKQLSQFTTEPMAREITCHQKERLVQPTMEETMARKVTCQQTGQKTQHHGISTQQACTQVSAVQELSSRSSPVISTQEACTQVSFVQELSSRGSPVISTQQACTQVNCVQELSSRGSPVISTQVSGVQELSSRGSPVISRQVSGVQELSSRGSPVISTKQACTQVSCVQELSSGTSPVTIMQSLCTQHEWWLQESPGRSLQIFNCNVGDPETMQPVLGYDLQDSTDRGRQDQLPLCFSVRQPEGNQCWYDASTAVDSVGSTATDISDRGSMPLFCDWEMVAESNPQPGRNGGKINVCEPDKFKGTHPNVVHPQQLHTASSVGGTEANSTVRVSLECRKSSACISPLIKTTSTRFLDAKEMEENIDSAAKLGEDTVTVPEDNAKFKAIILKAKETQQPTMEGSAKLIEVLNMLESSAKSEGSTGREDKNHIPEEDVSSDSPVQLVNRPPHHHLHPQVVEEVSEVLSSSQHSCYNIHGGSEDQRHHPQQHHLGLGDHTVLRTSADKSCQDLYNGGQPVITQCWCDTSTAARAYSVGSHDTSKFSGGIIEVVKSSASITSVHSHSMAAPTTPLPAKPLPQQIPATKVPPGKLEEEDKIDFPHNGQQEGRVPHTTEPGSDSGRQTAQQAVTDIHAMGREEAETSMLNNKAAAAAVECLDQTTAPPQVLQVRVCEESQLDTAEQLPIGMAVHHKSLVSQRSRSTAQLADNVQSTLDDKMPCGNTGSVSSYSQQVCKQITTKPMSREATCQQTEKLLQFPTLPNCTVVRSTQLGEVHTETGLHHSHRDHKANGDPADNTTCVKVHVKANLTQNTAYQVLRFCTTIPVDSFSGLCPPVSDARKGEPEQGSEEAAHVRGVLQVHGHVICSDLHSAPVYHITDSISDNPLQASHPHHLLIQQGYVTHIHHRQGLHVEQEPPDYGVWQQRGSQLDTSLKQVSKQADSVLLQHTDWGLQAVAHHVHSSEEDLGQHVPRHPLQVGVVHVRDTEYLKIREGKLEQQLIFEQKSVDDGLGTYHEYDDHWEHGEPENQEQDLQPQSSDHNNEQFGQEVPWIHVAIGLAIVRPQYITLHSRGEKLYVYQPGLQQCQAHREVHGGAPGAQRHRPQDYEDVTHCEVDGGALQRGQGWQDDTCVQLHVRVVIVPHTAYLNLRFTLVFSTVSPSAHYQADSENLHPESVQGLSLQEQGDLRVSHSGHAHSHHGDVADKLLTTQAVQDQGKGQGARHTIPIGWKPSEITREPGPTVEDSSSICSTNVFLLPPPTPEDRYDSDVETEGGLSQHQLGQHQHGHQHGGKEDPLEMNIDPECRVVLASIIVSAGMAPAPAAQRALSKPVKVVVVTSPPAFAWKSGSVTRVFKHIRIMMCCIPDIIVNTIAIGIFGMIYIHVSHVSATMVHPPLRKLVTPVAKLAAVVPKEPGQCRQLRIQQGQVSLLNHHHSEQENVRCRDILPDSTTANDDQKADCVQGTLIKFPAIFSQGELYLQDRVLHRRLSHKLQTTRTTMVLYKIPKSTSKSFYIYLPELRTEGADNSSHLGGSERSARSQNSEAECGHESVNGGACQEDVLVLQCTGGSQRVLDPEAELCDTKLKVIRTNHSVSTPVEMYTRANLEVAESSGEVSACKMLQAGQTSSALGDSGEEDHVWNTDDIIEVKYFSKMVPALFDHAREAEEGCLAILRAPEDSAVPRGVGDSLQFHDPYVRVQHDLEAVQDGGAQCSDAGDLPLQYSLHKGEEGHVQHHTEHHDGCVVGHNVYQEQPDCLLQPVGPLVGHHGVQADPHQVMEVKDSPEDSDDIGPGLHSAVVMTGGEAMEDKADCVELHQVGDAPKGQRDGHRHHLAQELLRRDYHALEVVLEGVRLASPVLSSSGWPEDDYPGNPDYQELADLRGGQESRLHPVCDAEEFEAAMHDQGPEKFAAFHHVGLTLDAEGLNKERVLCMVKGTLVLTFPVSAVIIHINGLVLSCPRHVPLHPSAVQVVPQVVPHQVDGEDSPHHAQHKPVVVCGDPGHVSHQGGVQKVNKLEEDGQTHSQSAPVPCDLHGAVCSVGALEGVPQLPVQGGGLVHGGDTHQSGRSCLMLRVQLKHLEIQESIFYLELKTLIETFPEGKFVTESVTHDLNTSKDDVKLTQSYVKLIFHKNYDIMMTSLVKPTNHSYTMLGRVTNDLATEVLELSMKQDNTSQRVKEEPSTILSSVIFAETNLLFMARREDQDRHHVCPGCPTSPRHRDALQVKMLKNKKNKDTAYLYTGQVVYIVISDPIAQIVEVTKYSSEQQVLRSEENHVARESPVSHPCVVTHCVTNGISHYNLTFPHRNEIIIGELITSETVLDCDYSEDWLRVGDTSNVSHLLVPKEITITNTEMLDLVQQEVEYAGQVLVVHPHHKDPHLAACDLGHHISDAPVGGGRDIFVKEVLRDVSGQPDQAKVIHLQAVPGLQEHQAGHDEVAGSALILIQQNMYILTTRTSNILHRTMMKEVAFWVLVRGHKFYSLTLNRLLMHTVRDIEAEMSNAMVSTIRRMEAEVDNFHTACSVQETRCLGFLGFP